MDLINYFDLELRKTHLNERDLYRLMGYGDHIPSEDILQVIDEMLSEIITFCTPRCGYKICTGKRVSKIQIEVDGISMTPGAIISSAMREAEYIAVFTSTLGRQFDDWMKSIQLKDNIMHDFIANSLGSILAEGVTNELMNILSAEAENLGLKISNNYSPGYCSWVLTEQELLFSILPNEVPGITLTESCLMLPIKSVSGIVAIGNNVKKRPYGCSVCNMKKMCNMSKFTFDSNL